MEVQTPARPPWQQILLSLWRNPAVRIALAVFFLLFIAVWITFSVFYSRYERIVDDRIRRPIFNEPAQIFAAADRVGIGDERTMSGIIAELRSAGYVSGSDGTTSNVGVYSQHGPKIQVRPGPASYQPGQEATLRVADGEVQSITGPKGESLSFYDLEPQLVTDLFDAKSRSKRRLLTYAEIPAVVRDAIVSVEDRRFFEHRGINYVRLAEGLLTPILRHRRMQGGSTLTMQMARSFFLSNERSARRKLAEMMIALILERRFTKEQILEIYVNQVDLGQRGSFNIRGFGEAAQAYFGKDVKSLNLPQAALLAGLVNGPSYFSPFRHPDRALTRRNVVLNAMYENHVISKEKLAEAKATPLKLAPVSSRAEEAPYYVDLVRDRLLSKYSESELDTGALRVYTALDSQLQKAAAEAVEAGMQQVDAAIIRQRTRKIRQGKGKNATVTTQVAPGPMPQVALIALDPHTGEVLALAGGRDYSASQLNHALSNRPTGSIFKPFVYAAAMNTALTGDPAKAFTQITMLDASEGVFDDNGKPWSPHNFDSSESTGEVTARFALAHSINTATVRLAQMVGLDNVVQLAKSAGIEGVKATPSMAIGTYSATPLEMAGAYTVFANGGVRLPTTFIRSIRTGTEESDRSGVEDDGGSKATVLDSRVAYVMTDMMQAVLDGGTASAVRARFNSPAAGKTGSSHDAWFAGYTSNLLCIIWVGNDDYTDIKIEGARAAAPIWTDFMLRARKLSRYHDMKPFTPPAGVLPVHLDKASNLPADDTCPDDYDAYFIDGTIPSATCGHPEGPSRNLFEKMFGIGGHPKPVLPPITEPVPPSQGTTPGQPTATNPGSVTPPTNPEVKPKKKGFWHRLFGGGKKDEDSGEAPAQPPAPQ
ncbi:MAG: Penicillin-binding protein [Bryobacterales bacterium]|nr:Penicillin-binding protein [Bryobacterales bacterium]